MAEFSLSKKQKRESQAIFKSYQRDNSIRTENEERPVDNEEQQTYEMETEMYGTQVPAEECSDFEDIFEERYDGEVEVNQMEEMDDNYEESQEESAEDEEGLDISSEEFFKFNFKNLGQSKLDFKTCLTIWSLYFGIHRNALDSLLNIIYHKCKCKFDIPRTSKTLVGTPKTKINPISMGPKNKSGEYHHLGLKNHILKNVNNYDFLKSPADVIEIDVNIDGFSPFESHQEVWPILGAFSKEITTPPFVIGLYWSRHGKPASNNEYLKPFVDEILEINRNGIEIDGRLKKIKIHHIGCDAPAKSFVKGVQGHTGNHACHFCDKIKESFVVTTVENGIETRKNKNYTSTSTGNNRTDSGESHNLKFKKVPYEFQLFLAVNLDEIRP